MKRSNEDFILDDSAVAVDTERGMVIITGCSHAGICNIIDHAKKVTGETKYMEWQEVYIWIKVY